MTNEEKAKAIKLAVDKIEKGFGKGAVMVLSEKPLIEVDVISTGSIGIDIAIGIGGLPKGRIVEVYGPESSGKSTLAISTIAQLHAKDPNARAFYIDSEHAFDLGYAQDLGVDVDRLYFSQPSNGEEALEIAHSLFSSKAFDMGVIDSVAALTPKAEIDGEFGESKMGLQARLMSQGMRKLVGIVSTSNTLLIFINQLRDKIGVMFGSPETVTGGNALKFYASVRLDIRRQTQIKDGDEVMGNKTKVKVVKNKLAPPFKICEFDIIFGKGINKAGEILDISVELGLIEKSGSWFSYNESKIGQGRDAVVTFLNDNPEVQDELEEFIRSKFNLQ